MIVDSNVTEKLFRLFPNHYVHNVPYNSFNLISKTIKDSLILSASLDAVNIFF